MRVKFFAALALLAASTGCVTSRSILSVAEAGDRNLTLIQTSDTYSIIPGFYGYQKHQFWSCRETGDTLMCSKSCDTKNSQLACMIQNANPGAASNQAANSTSK